MRAVSENTAKFTKPIIIKISKLEIGSLDLIGYIAFKNISA